MKTLDAWIETHAQTGPGRRMLACGEKTWSYGRMARAVGALTAFLQDEAGLEKGARIGWLGYNRAEFIMLVFAAARAGMIVVPLNWRLAAPEQAHILQDAGARLLVAQPDPFGERAREIAPAGCRLMLLDGPSGDDAMAFSDALEAQGAGVARGGPEDPLLLVYTSGTTGRPKGAVLTQDAILFNALNAIHMHGMGADDVILSVLPLFHVGGLNIQTMPAFLCGASVIVHETFDPLRALMDIARWRASLTLHVPATLQAMMALPEWRTADISTLRALATGSTIVPLPLIEAVQERGVSVIQIYGATETGPVCIYQTPREALSSTGSIGRQGLHSEIRLVDEAGREVAQGKSGEILVRGRHLARGYWNDPENPAFRDGWFHTGDMASRDENGLLWFRGRKKTMIISGGENIYPAEIEQALMRIPGVAACAVAGIPHDRWGETPAALIVPQEGASLDARDIRAALEGTLARYKLPGRIEFAPHLPRNAMGKVVLDEVRRILMVTPR